MQAGSGASVQRSQKASFFLSLPSMIGAVHPSALWVWAGGFFFFKQKTAYEIGLGIPAEPLFRSTRRRLRSFAASWLLNALLRIFAMSIITPKRKVLRMSVQDCWRPPL